MKTLKTLAIAFLACLSICAQAAGGPQTGTLGQALPMPDGEVLFYFSGSPAITGSPCTYTTRFAVDGTTTAGKQQVALLTAAIVTSATITYYGSGTCSSYGSELISYAVIVY